MQPGNPTPNEPKEEGDYRIRLEHLTKLVNLINDIFLSAWENYGASKRMYRHRHLCMGTLLVARQNTEATVYLIQAGLVHQVNYISRNMLELTINLCYILDDETQRDARVDRYIRYSDEILPYRAWQASEKYPEMFVKKQASQDRIETIRQRYGAFVERYREKQNKDPNIESWIGMNMGRMIDAMKNEETRQGIRVLYDIVARSNNFYLHPSWYYLKSAISETVKPDKNYEETASQMTMIFLTACKVVTTFLEQFPKRRPEFLEKLGHIKLGFHLKSN